MTDPGDTLRNLRLFSLFAGRTANGLKWASSVVASTYLEFCEEPHNNLTRGLLVTYEGGIRTPEDSTASKPFVDYLFHGLHRSTGFRTRDIVYFRCGSHLLSKKKGLGLRREGGGRNSRKRRCRQWYNLIRLKVSLGPWESV